MGGLGQAALAAKLSGHGGAERNEVELGFGFSTKSFGPH